MKNIALVVGLPLVLVGGAMLGASCSNGGGDTPPATTIAAALTTTTTTTTICPAGPHTVAFVLIAPDTLAYPGPQRVCPDDTVTWTLENKCEKCGKTKLRILGGRRRHHQTACGQGVTINEPMDCFKKDNGGADCERENGVHAEYGKPAEKIGECTIKDAGTVKNGCFKYSLIVKPQSGHFPVDPEIEVQGGNAIETNGSPAPAGSPTVKGSPAP